MVSNYNFKSLLAGWLALLILLALPALSLGAGEFVTCDGPAGIETATVANPNSSGGTRPIPCDLAKLFEMLNKIISYLAFRITPIIATIAILWAGIDIVTHPGNANVIGKAKNLFWTVVLGLIIVFSAYLLMQAIIFSLASDNVVGSMLKNLFR